MRLVTYHRGECLRLAAVVGNMAVDLNLSYGRKLEDQCAGMAWTRADEEMPPDMISFLNLGQVAMDRANEIVEAYADPALQEEALERGWAQRLDSIRLAAPVPVPGRIIVGRTQLSRPHQGITGRRA